MSAKKHPISPPAQPAAVPPVDQAAPNRVLALVYHFMSIWDRNADAAPLIDLFSPDGFAITLLADNKRVLTTSAAVQAWFAETARQVKQVHHVVESIDVSPQLPGGGWPVWPVHVRVHAQGIAADGSSFLLRGDHHWEVVDYGGLVPRITKITIDLVPGA
jgi:hypothetical protein